MVQVELVSPILETSTFEQHDDASDGSGDQDAKLLLIRKYGDLGIVGGGV